MAAQGNSWGREWRLLQREPALTILAVVFAALALFAAINGASWARFQHRTIATLRAEETQRIDSVAALLPRLEAGPVAGVTPFNDPRSAAVSGRASLSRWLVLPPTSLQPLAVGQSDLFPYFIRLTTQSRQSTVVNDEIENPLTLLTGRLDLSFVTLVVFPLLVLALTYNVVSLEREQGTLALLMSQPVVASRVLLRKLLVRSGVLLVLASVIALGAALGTGATLTTPETAARFAWWLTIVVCYGAFWCAVALVVNAKVRSSAASAVAVLGVWFALIVGIPALSSAFVAVRYPVPSRISLATALRAAENEQASKRPSKADALADFLVEHPQYRGAAKADSSNPQVIAVSMTDRLEQRIAPVFADFEARLRARQDAADRLRLLSPALAAQSALLDAAGTGPSRYRRFEEQWKGAHDAWRGYFNRKVFAGESMAAADVAQLPVFAYSDQPIAALTGRLALSLAAIVVPALLLGVWGYRALGALRSPHA